jgi:hypothetical protein
MKNLIHTAVVTLFAASAAQAQQAVQWKVADGGNGHWYAVQRWHELCSFDVAADVARLARGHIATLNSGQEVEFVCNLAAAAALPAGAWTGGVVQNSGCCGWSCNGCSGPPCIGGSPSWENGEAWNPALGDYVNCWGGGRYGLVARGGLYWAPTWVAPAANDVSDFVIEWSADCNSDGIVDYGQILQGQLADTNTDGIPDACQCATNPSLPNCCFGDINGDHSVDGADIGLLLYNWGPCGSACLADLNSDGSVNGGDIGLLMSGWGPCTN